MSADEAGQLIKRAESMLFRGVENGTAQGRATGELVAYTTALASVEIALNHLEKAAEQVVWQVENKVWTLLGYADWDEMREAEYKGAAVIVPRADRPELVARLRREGLTHEQIGETVGVSESTARSDNRKVADTADLPETRTDSLGRQRPTTYRHPDPPDLTDEDEEERQRLVATHLLCEHLVTVAQMRGFNTAKRYDPTKALPGRAVTRKVIADAITAAEEIAAIWKERELP